MKRLNNVSPARDSKVIPLKYLVVVMAAMMTLPVAQADVANKKIGDLEIYKVAEGGKTTITMMLDTSGSMSALADGGTDACDLPTGVSSNAIKTETSTTNPTYPRIYCESINKQYFYKKQSSFFRTTWYRCGSSSLGSDNNSSCETEIRAPSTNGLENESGGFLSGITYYYKNVGYTNHYDRLTRLKDAIFTLMNNTTLDPNKVSIGIGQYSTQSNSNNVKKDADGRSGKILVPAALLTPTQRLLIKTRVADLLGASFTPTANAYAEVGAYMLGKNTSGTGSGFDQSVTASKDGSNYSSPLSNPSSCDGRGIYFLTDGEPNSSSDPLSLMKKALGNNAFSLPSVTLPNGTQNNSGMPQVGAFAKALRDPAINPLGTDKEIYTAVVGFGSVFNVDASNIVNLPYTNPKTGITANRDFYNCANISNIDAKNACNWGEKAHPDLPGVGGFGEGGFYSAQSTEDIVKSITSFVSGLNQNLPSTPSGTIIIPDDPYRADSQLAVAYYPTLQADVAGNSVIWDGNMKKYSLNEGTLYGSNDNKLFKNVAGELEPTTPDLWSDKDYGGANNKVKSGGFYALLNTPKTGVTSTRTLYVEDLNGTTPVLRKFWVNDSGKVVVDNAALTTTSFSDTATFDEITLRRLLNFLGFDNLPSTAVKDMTLTTTANATMPIRVVGATIHSTPAAVSYAATLDDDGKVTAVRDDYVLFGSSEGGLHLVDADNYSAGGDGGKEDFVVIPREILRDKSKSLALVDDSTKAQIGSPNFGIDAPWLVSADYKYDLTNNTVNIATDGIKGLYAYGGLRMGGEAFYGLNLTTRTSPRMMFTITPTSTGFGRMGQIWSKPTKAKIKRTSTDTGTDVLVFGGGYDMCYEYEKFQVGVTDTDLGTCSGKTDVKGNAVYIINAQNGSLIWSASSNGSPSTTVGAMTNSVVAGITTLDRDNDGFMDHIYFADLGGQLFRADFTNAGFKTPSAIGSPAGTPTPTTAFANTRVTRILSGAYTGTDTKFNHRFYERPVVSFHRNSLSNNLFALVNVISGDRSSPLSKIRDLSKSDRLYGIMDTDVTKADNFFYASNFTSTAAAAGGQSISNLTANNTATSNLLELPGAIGTLGATGYTLAQKNVVSNLMRAGTNQGWYYPLTRFDGYGNVRYTKGIGKSQVIDSFLYTTAYNPDMSYGSTNTCSAKIVGGSERQLYCLPYGICTDANSKNGTGGFVRAGQGLQELTLGPRSSTLSNQRLLIGTRTLAERATDRVDFGSDTGKDTFSPINEAQGLVATDQILGSGSAPELIFNERFILQPKTWYEVD